MNKPGGKRATFSRFCRRDAGKYRNLYREAGSKTANTEYSYCQCQLASLLIGRAILTIAGWCWIADGQAITAKRNWKGHIGPLVGRHLVLV